VKVARVKEMEKALSALSCLLHSAAVFEKK
jgi:hypothetical protein